jgi:energy-coupling factor transport system permease protein
MSVWLEYEERDTPLHSLHPFSKLVLTISGAFLAGIWWDPRYLAPLLLVGLGLVFTARVPRNWFKPLVALCVAVVPTTVIKGVFQTNPELFDVYPTAFAATEIATFQLPVFGSAGLTYGSVLWMVGFVTKLVVMALFVYTFIYTTRLSDLTQSLNQYFPYQVSYVIMVGLKFVPYMIRRFRTIHESQKLRGLTFATRNPLKLAKTAFAIVRPLFRMILETIEEVTAASQIRAFGSRHATTQVRELPFRRSDKTLVSICVVTVLAAVVGMIWLQVGLI